MSYVDTWDKISQEFNTHQKGEVAPSAADNMLIAWPVFFKFIDKYAIRGRALDFGCGAGGFCSHLDSLNFDTTGVDYSDDMVETAKANVNSSIQLCVGESSKVFELSQDKGKFDLIVSIMTFQFIKDIETTLRNISNSMNSNAVICFACFNPNWVEECLKEGAIFSDPVIPNSVEEVTRHFDGGLTVPSYNRKPSFYHEIMEKLGFEKLLEEYPPFTSEFIEKYGGALPHENSEFMILGYRKK